MLSLQQKNLHLLWRAGFGPMTEQIPLIDKLTADETWTSLLKSTNVKPDYIDVAGNAFDGLTKGIGDIGRQNQQLSDEEKKQMRQRSRENIKSLNLQWLDEMVNSGHQLREKMAFFWHGHFASRNLNVLYQQQLLQVVRSNALGNFRDLLHEVSRSAAMINFLNNNQNRKGRPNENFAREVMELFTTGRGQYTEADIREAARAFTGWGANLNGEFVFRRFQHDDGVKEVFGKRGNFTGEDILEMLLEKKETAAFICGKLCRYLVHPKPNSEIVRVLGEKFYSDNYNIASLLDNIFRSTWFFEDANFGARIKSPIELLVGVRRMIPVELENEEIQLLFQRVMGQLLFYPPNVAGWPEGTAWIDSSSLMFRMRIPAILSVQASVDLMPKTDDDQAMGRENNRLPRNLLAKGAVRWNLVEENLRHIPDASLQQYLLELLLPANSKFDSSVLGVVPLNDRLSTIKTLMVRIMSTPDYQLC